MKGGRGERGAGVGLPDEERRAEKWGLCGPKVSRCPAQTRGDAGPHGHGVGALARFPRGLLAVARSEARGLLSPPAL